MLLDSIDMKTKIQEKLRELKEDEGI